MAIKAAVPGLITDGAPSTTTTSALIVASTDPSAAAGRSTGLNNTHKALVPADAFNVSVLFGPTLAFLDRVKEVMPGGLMGEDETSASTGFNGFLDEFVLRTFLPQLEEKVASVFHQAVGGIDAFQEDPNSKRVSRVPIVRVSPASFAVLLAGPLLTPASTVRLESDAPHLGTVLHAPRNAVPPRELLAAHRQRHPPVLPALFRALQGCVCLKEQAYMR